MIRKLLGKFFRLFPSLYVAGCTGIYGRLYIDGKREEALEKYSALLEEYPTDTSLLRAMAMLNLWEGRYEDSRIFCERILRIEPNDEMTLGFLRDMDEREARNQKGEGDGCPCSRQ